MGMIVEPRIAVAQHGTEIVEGSRPAGGLSPSATSRSGKQSAAVQRNQLAFFALKYLTCFIKKRMLNDVAIFNK